MKKLICLLLVLVLCLSLSVTVLAVAEGFVPSIEEKGEPEIVPSEGGIAEIINVNDNAITDLVEEHCLVITPLSKANSSDKIPPAAREELLEIYEALKKGETKIPYDKVDPSLMPKDWVVRDLFDASFLCDDHPELLAKEEEAIRLRFDINIPKNEQVIVMYYKDGQWNPARSVVNNGDGTITVVLDDICPIAFCVKDSSKPPQTGDTVGQNMPIYVGIMAVSAIALVGVVVIYRKKTAK